MVKQQSRWDAMNYKNWITNIQQWNSNQIPYLSADYLCIKSIDWIKRRSWVSNFDQSLPPKIRFSSIGFENEMILAFEVSRHVACIIFYLRHVLFIWICKICCVSFLSWHFNCGNIKYGGFLGLSCVALEVPECAAKSFRLFCNIILSSKATRNQL